MWALGVVVAVVVIVGVLVVTALVVEDSGWVVASGIAIGWDVGSSGSGAVALW